MNQFLISRIFVANIYISFFSLCFDLFSIVVKKVNQIRNIVVCVVARLVFMFCCALTTGSCNAFQHISVDQKKQEFYGPYFQTMLFLVTMFWRQNFRESSKSHNSIFPPSLLSSFCIIKSQITQIKDKTFF